MISALRRERNSRGRAFAWMGWLGGLALLLSMWLGASSDVSAASPEPDWRVEPAPKWVEPAPGPADPGFASAHPIDGLAYELIDTQKRIVGGKTWNYTRVVVRVLSEAGVEIVGQQNFGFSPPNERLVLHDIRIHRGESSFDRLEPKDVQLLQREANLEQLIYDNRRTAFVLIPDVRIGDVVEYAWSVVEENPVMDGRVGVGLTTQHGFAVGAVAARVLSDRELRSRGFGGAPTPTMSRSGAFYEYALRSDSVPAAPDLSGVPVEDATAGWVQLTDFGDWADVAQWGVDLFESEAEHAPAVTELLARLDLAGASEDEQTLAVLAWVQREIRYFTLPFAESTHRPASPATVLERRYGDCKDMALLTTVMLRELGIDAYVALVDLDGGRFIPRMLPSPYAFDHAIVVAFPQGSRVWIDPTSSHQANALQHVAARGLHWALPLRLETDSLVSVEEPDQPGPDLAVDAVYTVTAYDAPAELTMTARFSGTWADSLRYMHATRDAAGFSEVFESGIEADLRRAHPAAEAMGPVGYADDTARNIVTVSRTFGVPQLWVENDGRWEAEIQPFSLFEVLTDFEDGRSLPLAIGFPDHRVHRSILEMHEPFEFEFDDARVDDGPVFFLHSRTSEGPRVELRWELENRRHRVEVHELPAYRSVMDTVDENFGVVLFSDLIALQGEQSFNWSVFAGALLWTLMLVAAAVWIVKRAPYLRRDHIGFDPSLEGLSGWLVLVGFGLIATVFGFVRDLWQTLPAYSNEAWITYTTPGTADYVPQWAPLLLFELFGNLMLVVLAALSVFTYFKKHRSFPVLFIALHLGSAIMSTVDAAVIATIDGMDEPSVPFLLGQWLRCALWVAYGLRSVRMRSTFLPKPEDYDPNAGPLSFAPRR